MSNAGFEAGLTDWTVFTGSETITSDAFAGTQALALSSNKSGIDQGFSVVAGETYSLSTYAKTSSPDWSGIGIRFYDAQWNELDGSATRIDSSNWDEYTVDAIAPAGAVNGIYWAWKGGDTGVTTLDEFGISSDSTPPPSSSGELLSNPSFESGLTNWNVFKGTGTIATDTAMDGYQSLQIGAHSGASQHTPVTVGATYQLTGFAKTDGNGWSGFGLDFFDEDWNKIEGYSEQITTSAWSEYELEYTAPANAVRATTWVWKGGNSGSTYLDNVSLQLASTSANQGPTITSNGGEASATIHVDENNQAIANIDSIDPDGEAEGKGLTYTLEGPDISQITIDSSTGELSFKNVPDFENPTDGNGDNQYEVDVVVTDSAGESDRQSLTIAVNDIQGEPPIERSFTNTITINVGFNPTNNDPAFTTVLTGSSTLIFGEPQDAIIGDPLLGTVGEIDARNDVVKSEILTSISSGPGFEGAPISVSIGDDQPDLIFAPDSGQMASQVLESGGVFYQDNGLKSFYQLSLEIQDAPNGTLRNRRPITVESNSLDSISSVDQLISVDKLLLNYATDDVILLYAAGADGVFWTGDEFVAAKLVPGADGNSLTVNLAAN